jgi:GPH family glycoside/pentoside/hexuronide:cation symporter
LAASPALEPAAEPRAPAAAERLELGVKLAYGMPNFAGAAMAIPIAIHMPIFYSDVVLVPLGYIALAVAVARAFDAIADPLMGWITDRTNTRWGRRRPWMFVGAPLAAISFYLLFAPPEGMDVATAFAWFGTAFTLYFLLNTVYQIPHYGLGPELTSDYRERSSLFAWMEGFALLGTMCAAALPGLVLEPRLGARLGFKTFAAVFGTLLTLLYFWQCWRIQERPDYFTRKPNPLAPGVRRVLRNRPFRILLASYVVGSITGAIPGLMMPYFTTYVLQPENPGRVIGGFLLAYFGAGFLTLPLWLRVVRRFGKKPAYVAAALMGVAASTSLFFMGKGDLLPTLLVLLWAGSAFGVRIFLGPSIQADVIDYDELYTGKRREAQYGALWAIMTKFVVIPGAAIPLSLLAWLGYQPNVEQSETVQLAIRAIFGLGPATFGTLSLLVFLLFPINQKNHAEVLVGISRHRQGLDAVDPLTGRTIPPPERRSIDEDTGWFLDHFSVRELRRAVARGSRALVASTWRAALISGALCVAAVTSVVPTIGSVRDARELPFTTVFEVVVAGFALSACLYHLLRARAARQLQREPLAPGTLEAHLTDVGRLSQSSSG